MRRVVGIALAGVLVGASAATALARPPMVRVRGTIETVNGPTVTIKTYDGHTENLQLGRATKFVSVIPGHLKDVAPGEFVGIGATGPTSKITAIEVVIFPNSMRGIGEGHYPWSVPAAVAAMDRHQTTSPPAGAPPVQGTMTNATITSTSPAVEGAPPVQGTMTNGTVASSATASGGVRLTVSYDHGKHVQIVVPADAPVVHLVPATRHVLMVGAKTFAIAAKGSGGALEARFVAVGESGLMPPM